MREHETLMESYLIDVLRLHPLSFSSSFFFAFFLLFHPVPFLFSSLSPSVSFSLDDLCDSAPLCGFEKLFNATSSKLCNVRSERKLDDYAKRVRFFCLPLDNGSFSPSSFVPSSLPSEILAQCAISSPVLSPSLVSLYLFLIVSRYTLNRPPPHGAVYRGIQYLQSSRIWTHSASFARTLSPSPPPVGIFRLLLFAMLIMLTLDTILFCFIPVNTSRFRPLFVQRATAVTIDRAAFIRVTVSKPFSFIYNLCSRFCQILA